MVHGINFTNGKGDTSGCWPLIRPEYNYLLTDAVSPIAGSGLPSTRFLAPGEAINSPPFADGHHQIGEFIHHTTMTAIPAPGCDGVHAVAGFQ